MKGAHVTIENTCYKNQEDFVSEETAIEQCGHLDRYGKGIPGDRNNPVIKEQAHVLVFWFTD